MEITILLVVFVVIILVFVFRKKKTTSPPTKMVPTPIKWKTILSEKVNFYRNLDENKKLQFEFDIQRFLKSVRINGVKTDVDLEDRLLVASSAVIPLFGFPAWTYKNINEVLIYPSAFDRNFNLNSQEEVITGMVGSGAMEGKMILSKPSLHRGFEISNDKKNVGIHEFVHLFDKETGEVDGIPPGYEERSFALPWLDLINGKTNEIVSSKSDINKYGATSRVEFFAVASEYFFERPHLLKEKHPKLYSALSKIFNQDLTAVIDKSSFSKQKPVGRNEPCPCGSGLKYKRCCID